MKREARNQQDRRTVGVACDIHQRAIGSPLPGISVAKAPWRQRRSSDRASRAASKSTAAASVIFQHLIAKRLFSGYTGIYIGWNPWVARAFRNSVTLQPSLHCSLTAYQAHLCGASLDCSPFQPLRFGKQAHATIALVDDDRNILTSVSIALEAEGYRIMTYTDGASALDGFRTSPPDLAILDIKMPRMDGMETLRRLRQKSDLPVIFLTSKDEEIDELFGLKMGADDFIRKPFSQRLLVERVKAVLRRARRRIRPRRQRKPTPRRWIAACCAWTRSATPAPGRTSR